jgi:hypothetical protein
VSSNGAAGEGASKLAILPSGSVRSNWYFCGAPSECQISVIVATSLPVAESMIGGVGLISVNPNTRSQPAKPTSNATGTMTAGTRSNKVNPSMAIEG